MKTLLLITVLGAMTFIATSKDTPHSDKSGNGTQQDAGAFNEGSNDIAHRVKVQDMQNDMYWRELRSGHINKLKLHSTH